MTAARWARLAGWLRGHRDEEAWSSNVGAEALPFQRWFHFKEAFSPKFVAKALDVMPGKVRRCADPFGGSGTTALTCSFLGIECETIEVNPFLSDLIEAKVACVDVNALREAMLELFRAPLPEPDFDLLISAPATLVEPGLKGRWVFPRDVAGRILSYRQAIEQMADAAHARLFRVLLGSLLTSVSNVLINGKGRRYRADWQTKQAHAAHVDHAFRTLCFNALSDLTRFRTSRNGRVRVHRGDSREMSAILEEVDAAVFSPPYPNSFDYTDVYNLELWMLGYLATKDDNQRLRSSTLHSHVQIKRDVTHGKMVPAKLSQTLGALNNVRDELWNPHIPGMVASYFGDIEDVLKGLAQSVRPGGGVAIVVGGSSYRGIFVDAPAIIADVALEMGYELCGRTPIRAMRLSAQQGGRHGLGEDLLLLQTPKGRR